MSYNDKMRSEIAYKILQMLSETKAQNSNHIQISLVASTIKDECPEISKLYERDQFKKDYLELVDNNDHTGAASILINRYGTSDDKMSISRIQQDHEDKGEITPFNQELRDALVKKYIDFINYD